MKVMLMNKNKIILKAEMVESTFIKIIEVVNINYAPLSIYNGYYNKTISFVKSVNDWFKGRSIPSWRKDLEKLLNNLKVYDYGKR